MSTNPRPDRKAIYRQVALYDPETRRKKTVLVKKSDFDTPEACEEYCKKIMLENKIKNAELRRQKRVARFKDDIERIDKLTALAASRESKLVELDASHGSKITQLVIPAASSSISLSLSHSTGSTLVIYGSSKRGKSTLMMHLYKKYFRSKENINTLFSGNPHLKVYKKDSRLLVGYGFGEEHAKYIMMQQYINVKTGNEYRFINLFDDIIDQKYAPVMNKMMLTYRNANISLVIALQYVLLLSKQNRANVNHSFVFGMNSVEDIESVIERVLRPYFLEMNIKPEYMIEFFKAVTADHGFIYLDNVNNKISFHRLNLKGR